MKKIWQDSALVFTRPVRDPLWGNILLPQEFDGIINAPDFMKLGRIAQLGPSALVYPGATHTRRAHSFGVFYLARRLLDALSDRYPDFSLQPTATRSFLVAALCHDVGHFPYTHSLKELPLTEHESLSATVLCGALADAVRQAGAEPDFAAAIIDRHRHYEHPELAFLRKLLSGVLDPDKLDYLNRDAWACGVPYGTQDVDFILQHLALTSDGALAIDERGIMAVEAVLFSKYQMYRAVYWHRNVRGATAMIKKALLAELGSGRLHGQDLYGLDDAGFYSLIDRCSLHSAGLIGAVLDGRLYSLCYEAAFNETTPLHARCLNLEQRGRLENDLAAELSGRNHGVDVVIDIPEPISFEADLTVLEAGRPFNQVSAVFGEHLLPSFQRELRVVRIFCSSPQANPRHIAAWAERVG